MAKQPEPINGSSPHDAWSFLWAVGKAWGPVWMVTLVLIAALLYGGNHFLTQSERYADTLIASQSELQKAMLVLSTTATQNAHALSATEDDVKTNQMLLEGLLTEMASAREQMKDVPKQRQEQINLLSQMLDAIKRDGR